MSQFIEERTAEIQTVPIRRDRTHRPYRPIWARISPIERYQLERLFDRS